MVSREHNPPSGIGGWLILPAIGVIWSPISWALYLVQVSQELFSERMWIILTDRTSSLYQPLWPATRGFEVIGALALLALTIQIAFNFFRCRRKLPGLIILGYLGSFLFAWILVILWSLPSMTDHIDLNELGAINRNAMRATIAVLVWVPYFTFSKRVRATFLSNPVLESPPQNEATPSDSIVRGGPAPTGGDGAPTKPGVSPSSP